MTLQDGAERLADELADGEVDEDRHEQDGRDGEPERDPKLVRARLEQALQADVTATA